MHCTRMILPKIITSPLRCLGFLLCGVVIVSLPGCGNSGRVAVDGTVTLDGQPLDQAQIEFIPMAGTPGPTAGGDIIAGKYLIAADKGPFAGKYRVRIVKSGPTGRKTFDPRSNSMIEEYGPILPARYNEQSELEAEITSAGPNRFDFTLTSK